ncbi:LOW QUALITY PROTEIN: small ribosomal subunit protein uS15m [Urocitellus parryii]
MGSNPDSDLALVFGLLGSQSTRLPSDLGLLPQSLLQAAGGYAIQTPPKQDHDPSSSTLLKEYQNILGIKKVDDVVRFLFLEMANQKGKLRIKQEELMNTVMANPEDTRSLEAQIVALTIKIHSYEHMQKQGKDKRHKRYLLMIIDQRSMLKNLRKNNYDVFEKAYMETRQHTLRAQRRGAWIGLLTSRRHLPNFH